MAQQSAEMGFTSLAYFIDKGWLREAYRRTRKDAAVGVDGQTATDYAADLEENLHSLLGRAKSGRYKAPPVRRVEIPKGKGKTRPIGIPTFEDKVLQRAVTMVLEPIYEQDFLDCSYGFRPNRSPHRALEALWQRLMSMGGGWVLEVDIRRFFDTLDHAHLRAFVGRRVRDGVLCRLIGKWLHAGVLHDGCLEHPDQGTPQGGVISPLLANIYLHYVLDLWFEQQVCPRLAGPAHLIRYADDVVIVFSQEDDARRVLDGLPKRFGRFGLTLHPQKTRLVAFYRPRRGLRGRTKGKAEAAGTFELLGFTHYWGRSRRGHWVVQRKTAQDRLSRALRTVCDWCRRHRHQKVRAQHQALVRKLHGHYAYYGITGNYRSLRRFQRGVARIWRKWLNRRSQRRRMPWARFHRMLDGPYGLLRPRIVHSAYRS